MKKLIFVVIIAFCSYCYLGYHFIFFNSGLKILKKSQMSYELTFVDARGAKALKLMFNPTLVKAGVKDLIKKQGITVKVE